MEKYLSHTCDSKKRPNKLKLDNFNEMDCKISSRNIEKPK